MYEEYYEKIKQECLIRNLRPSTADVYFNQITVFLRWTGDKNPDDLSLSDVRNYISFLRLEKHFSTSYCKLIITKAHLILLMNHIPGTSK